MSNNHFFAFLNRAQFKSQSGQVAVIVFLIMAVLLVVGLSLATRTSQEIELAGQQEDTTRVFNAAETGIEQALSDSDNFEVASPTSMPIALEAETNTAGTITITPDEGFETTRQSGETATVFINSAQTGTLTIDWGSTTCPAALAITIYRNNGSAIEATHQGVKPASCTGQPYDGTNFTDIPTDPPVSANGINYTRRHTINIASGTEMVRIKPLYSEAPIFVSGTGSLLEPQSYDIRSQAQDTSAGSDTVTETRAIQVTRSRPAPPGILDYAVYSGASLNKTN